MKKVLLVEPIHPSGVTLLERAGLQVVVAPSVDAAALIAEICRDVFAVIVRTSPLPGAVLEAGHGLKIVSRHGIGCNNIDLAAADRLDILVANVPDANASSVAEYVITAIMLLSRKLLASDAALRAGKFCQPGASLPGLVKKLGVGGNELPGRCLGVVGLGKIGLRVAQAANAFLGMEVLAYDPFRSQAPDGITLVADLAEIWRRADFVTLHVPLTEKTENMINAATLAAMRPGCRLINASRGELVVEADLAEALSRGTIAGAALDVFRQEPPGLDNPLFSAPNTLLTPHVAGTTDEAVERLAIGSAQAVVDLAANRKPASLVNPQVWDRLAK